MIRKLIFAIICLLSLSGCDELDYKGSPQFILYLQDAPAQDFSSVSLSVATVELYDGANWTSVNCSRQSFNILDYNGQELFNLCKVDVEPKKYTQFRITFNKNNATVFANGTGHPLAIDDKDAVLTFSYEFEAVQNSQNIAIVDIDVAKSVIAQGENYKFIPSTRLVDTETWGVVSGVTIIAEDVRINERILITATRSDGYVAHGYTATKYGLIFIRLPQGSYTIEFTTKTVSTYVPRKVENVVVKPKTNTDIGFVNFEVRPKP